MLEAALAACIVVGISDGDTLTARCTSTGAQQYQQVRIRLAAIDAPESRQAFGSAAKKQLSDLCYGQPITVDVKDKDRYERLIANVTCSDKDASAYMVQTGYAWAYRKYLNSRYELLDLEKQARSERRGLWRDLDSATPPVAPDVFRRKPKE